VLTGAHHPLNHAILFPFHHIHLMQTFLNLQMGRAGKQVIREGSDEDDVPLAQRKRKVGASTQGPHGRGRTNPPAAPR
jgi:hypothetical protein